MQIDGTSATVLSVLNRANAAAESGILATTTPGGPASGAPRTDTTPSQLADPAVGLSGVGLSPTSVAVAQAAPGDEQAQEDSADPQEDAQEADAQTQASAEEADDARNAADAEEQSAGEEEQSEEADQQDREEAEGPDGLTDAERQVVRELERRDAEVRRHEAAHAAVGGQYAGAPQYEYERGPNGQLYAVGGSVRIDTSPVPGNPEATAEKLEQVQRAALAPASPSAQDLRVAAEARTGAIEARAEARAQAAEEAQQEREERQEREEESGVRPSSETDTGDRSSTDTATSPGPSAANGADGAESDPQSLFQNSADRDSRSNVAQPTDQTNDRSNGLAEATPNLTTSQSTATAGEGSSSDQDSDAGGIGIDRTPLRANDAALTGSTETTLGIVQTQSGSERADSALSSEQENGSEPTRDGRAALQQALFNQEPQTRTLLGQRAFEDAIRIREEATQSPQNNDVAQQVTDQSTLQALEAERDLVNLQQRRDTEDRTEANGLARSLIDGQRADTQPAPTALFA